MQFLRRDRMTWWTQQHASRLCGRSAKRGTSNLSRFRSSAFVRYLKRRAQAILGVLVACNPSYLKKKLNAISIAQQIALHARLNKRSAPANIKTPWRK